MKKCFLHILLVGVLGMLAVSCSDEYDSMGLDSRQAQVVFSVAMDTPVSRSRAAEDNTWGSQYDPSSPGDAYDNRIDINQFIVKIQDGEKEYKIKDIIKWKADGAENVYKFVGVVEGIDQSTPLSNPKVYVYANMGATTPAEDFRQDAANIPMWGVKNIGKQLTFAPGTRVDLEEISLLRAMAKLEVSLNDEMFKEFALTGATLNKHNSTGYTLPMLPNGFEGSTEKLDLEGVMHPIKDKTQASLELPVVETNSSCVVYLPEVENDDLQVTVKLKQKQVDENGNVTFGQEQEGTFSLSSDVVRNHWYKYTITGFAASQITVDYNTVPWTNVNIGVGGEGFLFLNKDVVEIYNSNISEGVLKFSSSSPIDTIEICDIYRHDRDGNVIEGEYDGFNAYYIDKFGQFTQLSIPQGNGSGEADTIIYHRTKAMAVPFDEKGTEGSIKIVSPFMADSTSDADYLKQDSHNNTIRYLEFKVTNTQGLTATFRVMQYPPVVITNEEGYFSYRDDHNWSNNDVVAYYTKYKEKSFFLTCWYPYHNHNWTKVPEDANIKDIKFDETGAGDCPTMNADAIWTEVKTNLNYTTDIETLDYVSTHVFQRLIYPDFSTTKDIAVGPSYYPKDENGNYIMEELTTVNDDGTTTTEMVKTRLRRHYVWDMQVLFWSKFVKKVYTKSGKSTYFSGKDRKAGQADICVYYTPTDKNSTTFGTHQSYSNSFSASLVNHRMYNIRTTIPSTEYIIGYPALTADGVTENNIANANKVSPNFVVASQLGATSFSIINNTIAINKKGYDYKVPSAGYVYKQAVRHCKNYVETTHKDLNGNGIIEENEITHYKDWRLPTKAELKMIIDYQSNSRVMDNLLTGQQYFCIIGNGENQDEDVESHWLLPNTISNPSTGYFVRCVRDVKPGENK